MEMFQWKFQLQNLLLVWTIILTQLCPVHSDMYRCLINFQYCLGSLLPIGYSMQSLQLASAVDQLRIECPTLRSVELCTRHFPCSHEQSRQRVEAYLLFFTWLCRNTQVLENNRACWEYPFSSDVMYCGQRHIAGFMGSRLSMNGHPCPYIREMTACIRERMQRRPNVCSVEAVQLYTEIITYSSQTFSDCSN